MYTFNFHFILLLYLPLSLLFIYLLIFVFCYILDEDTARKAKVNVDHTKTNVDIFQWSARKLPFKAESIDKFISDLPFGRRSGMNKKRRKEERRVTKK